MGLVSGSCRRTDALVESLGLNLTNKYAVGVAGVGLKPRQCRHLCLTPQGEQKKLRPAQQPALLCKSEVLSGQALGQQMQDGAASSWADVAAFTAVSSLDPSVFLLLGV